VAETPEEALEMARKESGNNTLTLADLKQDDDVVDTWFSSWLWPLTVFDGFDKPDELRYYYPTNLLVTGWDIMFFWVARMIMAGYEWAPELLGPETADKKGIAPFHEVFFTGMVRGVTTRADPHQTDYLEYEAYKPMAEAKMRQIADEIRERWPVVKGVAIVQRIGRLYPETPAVVVACSAGHRDTGVFEAARYGIDRLKEIVTVWKKEVGPDGEEWVEGEYTPKAGE